MDNVDRYKKKIHRASHAIESRIIVLKQWKMEENICPRDLKRFNTFQGFLYFFESNYLLYMHRWMLFLLRFNFNSGICV